VRAGGHEVVRTLEPGGTPVRQRLREVLLHHAAPALAEALAMFAARSAHVEA
jgi:dTMP kinase